MARLIDGDKLSIDFYDEYETEDDAYAYGYVSMYQIDAAPTIDAVSVVRCEECKYELICSHSVQHTTYEPLSVTIGYKSVNFCSYGERRKHDE